MEKNEPDGPRGQSGGKVRGGGSFPSLTNPHVCPQETWESELGRSWGPGALAGGMRGPLSYCTCSLAEVLLKLGEIA